MQGYCKIIGNDKYANLYLVINKSKMHALISRVTTKNNERMCSNYLIQNNIK